MGWYVCLVFLLLLCFFLFFLASAEFAAGLLAMAVLTAVEAFSLRVARRDRASSCGGGVSGMVVSLGAMLAWGGLLWVITCSVWWVPAPPSVVLRWGTLWRLLVWDGAEVLGGVF